MATTSKALARAILRGFRRAPAWLRTARWGIVAAWPAAGGRFRLCSWTWGPRAGSARRLVNRAHHGAWPSLDLAIREGRRIQRTPARSTRSSSSSRKNPSPAALVRAAADARQAWTGHAADGIMRGRDSAVDAAPGGVLMDLGPLVAVEYRAKKRPDGPRRGTYRHEFGEEGGRRPHLASDARGRLRIVGGSYIIAPEGIRD